MEKDLDINWETLFTNCAGDVDTQWKLFMEKLQAATSKNIPSKKMTQSKSTKVFSKKCPMDEKLRKAIKEKHRAWERAYSNKNDETKQRDYRRKRNKVKALTRKAQKEHELSVAKDAKTNPKRFWQYVKSKTKIKSKIADLVIDDNGDEETLTKTDTEKAEVLSDYFKTVFTNEQSEPPVIEDRRYTETLKNIDITEDMVLKKLKKLNISKSPGPDNIHPRILKEIGGTIAKPIALIYRTSMKTGELPQQWKEAKISAIFKKGSRKLASNHRPVSLTCILCKVLESIIRDFVITHFKKNKLFSKKQFGFINGRSTVLQLLNVLEDWTNDLDNLIKWSDTWLLKFHPAKCKVLPVGTNANKNSYYINGQKLEHTDREKDLGVTIDSQLTFQNHIHEKINKANQIMSLIRRTFSCLNEEIFKYLYKAFVRPYLEYAVQVWQPHLIKDTTALENVQRRATKLIPTLRNMSYEERLRKLELPSLAYRRLRGDMIDTYKQFNTYDPDVAIELQTSQNMQTRGHSKKLYKTRANKEIGHHSFSHRIITPWNSLTENIVCAPSVNSFENRLDKHWKNEDILYNYKAAPPGVVKKLESNIEA
eukprot:gene4410-4998_t